MEVIVDRDSVCMADDISSHTSVFTIPDDMPYSDFMELIVQGGYFPHINDNDVVWVLEHKNAELLTYITKPNRIFTRWVECDPVVSHDVKYSSDNVFYFRYCGTPLERAEYIYTEHSGNLDFMQMEGFCEEYLFYNVDKSLEQQWEPAFFYTDYKDIYAYQDKRRSALFLSRKHKKGSIVLQKTSCNLKCNFENRKPNHIISYSNIRAIFSEQVLYKNKFSCHKFTIALLSDEEDYIIFSSVCESENAQPCSLQEAMLLLEKRIGK